MKESQSTFLAGMAVILLSAAVSAGIHAWQGEVSLTEALAVSPVETMAVEATVPLVSLAEMQMAVEQGTHLLLDARSLQEYDQGHIPGAFSLPYEEFETAMQNLAGMFGPADPLIVYCSSATCDDALLVAKRLREAGFAEVSLFLAGWEGWSE